MNLFHLVRHGMADVPSETIAGRGQGFPLHPTGRQQAASLAAHLRRKPVQRIYSSPMERTRETAQILSDELGLKVEIADDLLEVDYGNWTGKHFSEIRADVAWPRFNAFRSSTRVPGGELALETQLRIVRFMLRVRDEAPGDAAILVSHGDVIRSAVAYFLGIPADLSLRIEIHYASLSTIRIDQDAVRVPVVNWTPE